ncbi:MAG: Lrp/AsnC family transcriptional regulator [Arenicella sp.]
MQFDKIDLKILGLLQKDAKLSVAQIAERVGLSQSPCWRRINQLEQLGVINAQVSLLNREALGLNVTVFTSIKLSAHEDDHLKIFEDAVRDIPEVVECHIIMGSVDYILKVVTTDIHAYEILFRRKLSQIPGVHEINSRMALSEVKSTTELPLRLVKSR